MKIGIVCWNFCLASESRCAGRSCARRRGVQSNIRRLWTSEGWGIFYPMATTVEQLAEQAMNLRTESRARLADLLVESLNADELGQIDRLWVSEAKRRPDEVRSGRVESIPGDEALRKVRDVVRR